MNFKLMALRRVERGAVRVHPDGFFYLEGRDLDELVDAPIGSEEQNLHRMFTNLVEGHYARPGGCRLANGGLQLGLTDMGRQWLEEAA